jgi:hypothetical protein
MDVRKESFITSVTKKKTRVPPKNKIIATVGHGFLILPRSRDFGL